MSLEVLVAAMDADIKTLAKTMHLATAAVITNQSKATPWEAAREKDGETYCLENGSLVRGIFQNAKGVGKSRNTSLSHATADLVLFSDEDIVLAEGYGQIIEAAFAKRPDADVLLFNVKVDPQRRTYWNTDTGRIRWYNYGRYPTYAVAARREKLQHNALGFSLLFGGGAPYSCGEDSLFLHDCLKAGLHLYKETACIGEETYRESTWFRGYNEKLFFDRGVLYAYLYGILAEVFGLRFLLSHRKAVCTDLSVGAAYKAVLRGIKEGRNLKKEG